jgi:hypothetical protein
MQTDANNANNANAASMGVVDANVKTVASVLARYGPTTDNGCQAVSPSAASPSANANAPIGKGMPPKSPKVHLIPPSVLNYSNPNTNANLSSGLDDADNDPQPVQPNNNSRKNKNHKRLSHRRSFSHGTIEEKEGENKSNGSNSNSNRHRRQDSNEEALMTFGIAAYTMT